MCFARYIRLRVSGVRCASVEYKQTKQKKQTNKQQCEDEIKKKIDEQNKSEQKKD
jgi:hypothetical protein